MSVITTDPIADLLARIRNSLAVGKTQLSIPHSKMKEQILKLMKARGFVADFKVDNVGFKSLDINLQAEGAPIMITGLKRLSKPGRRIYIKAADIPSLMGGEGLVIVSTSKGLMDGEAARKQGLGGEIIAQVW